MPEAIVGWRLDPLDRVALLGRFPPRYARTIADHVTHGRVARAPPLPVVVRASVIGHADAGTGVEALVVALNGSCARWDGSRYHLTWSLAPRRIARESNTVIATRGWRAIEDARPLRLTPAEWF